jgi:hypothetical protein
MELPPSPDSENSLISIDSAIARQISRSKSSHQPLSITAKQHSPARAAEEQTNEAHHAIRNEHSRGKPLPKSLEKTRKTSLRRVKNSTEVLRQRSTRAQHGLKPSDGTSASKEARNFTVGSVGTGGKLYLRYALSQPTPKMVLMHFWVQTRSKPATTTNTSSIRVFFSHASEQCTSRITTPAEQNVGARAEHMVKFPDLGHASKSKSSYRQE